MSGTIVGFDVQQITSDGGYLTDNGTIEPTQILLDGGNPTTGIPIGDIGQWAFVPGPEGTTDKIAFVAIEQSGVTNNPAAQATVINEAVTWGWAGGTGQFTIAANWTLVAGPGNSLGYPGPDDTAIDAGGPILATDLDLVGNTLHLGGTAAVAALITAGDTATSVTRPSIDSRTLIDSAVPGDFSPETSLIGAGGMFVNAGTIDADGPAGSQFTIAVAGTTIGGTFEPGDFLNDGEIEVNADNTLTVSIAGTAELFNAGEIVVNGGSLFVDAWPDRLSTMARSCPPPMAR